MRLVNEELLELEKEIDKWYVNGILKKGAPESAKELPKRYHDLYWQLKNKEMG